MPAMSFAYSTMFLLAQGENIEPLYYLRRSPCFLYPKSELFDQHAEKAVGVHYQHRPLCERSSLDSSLAPSQYDRALGIRSVV